MAVVLVHIDLDGDSPHASSLVALVAGRHIASSWGATLYAAVIAHDPNERESPESTLQIAASNVAGLDELQSKLALAGSDKVLIAVTDVPITPLWSSVGTAWQGIVDHLRPRLVLFGADSPSAAELGPRTGAHIGARLLMRALAAGVEEVELRDRDGGYVRVADSGAAVVLVGGAPAPILGDDDADFTSLAFANVETRIELVGTAPAEAQHARVLIAIGDDVLGEPDLAASVTRLAALLGARVVGHPAAMRAGLIGPGDVLDRNAPLAPELCVIVGAPSVDIAGSTSIIRIGGSGSSKHLDGALPGLAGFGLAELVRELEARP